MKLGAVENKARLALALFVLALLLTIGLSLALYSEARRELSGERHRRIRLEAALVVLSVDRGTTVISDQSLDEKLRSAGITGVDAALYSADGALLAKASTSNQVSDHGVLQPKLQRSLGQSGTHAPGIPLTRSENGYDIAESVAETGNVLVLARAADHEASPVIFYVFSYQIMALVLGLALILLLARWLLRPYRRMVEAARDSPVRASLEAGESEFVVETFQALIGRLQTKEKELAQLHQVERRRAERSERLSERLIANIPSGLVTVDPAGVVTSANSHARDIFGSGNGLGPHSTQPPLASEIDPGEDYRTFFKTAPRMIELVSECLHRGTAFRREEAEVSDSDGRIRHLGLSVSPITDGSHGIEGALCLMTDITEVIELRERMKLQESLANLGEMAAGLAHEFKNSLATIHGFMQLIEAPGAGREQNRSRTVGAVLNEVRLLARLVTDFLNFARPQQITLGDVSLRSVIEDCAAEISQLLDEGGITLKIEGRFANLQGDESLLTRAFANLLRNAAEAIDPQSPEKLIEVTGSIDAGKGKRYAHIRIRDTGAGIPGEHVSRIFIPFFTTKSRGYGIGLALVQKIVVAHGGTVSVERSDGSGTVFHCRLPLSPALIGMDVTPQLVN